MYKLLVVDDEAIIRQGILCSIDWNSLDIKAFEANNGITAYDMISKEKYDIVLLDIKMPEIDGKYLFEIIEEYDPKVKIIVSSVYPIDKQKALIPKATDYFDKSQGLVMLLDKVDTLLAGKTDERQLE